MVQKGAKKGSFGDPFGPALDPSSAMGRGGQKVVKKELFWTKREGLSGIVVKKGSFLEIKIGEGSKTCKRGVYRPPRFFGFRKSPTGS